MRWTQTLIPTMKENPSDADIKSHQLMVRAGLIRKLTAGAYSYLPLGWRALRQAAEIVREEMDRAEAVEIHMPALQPIELWEESGRAVDYGEDLMKFVDRHKKVNVLGPTHEEVVTDIVRDFISSYKQLPLTLYQIQTKFRDEIRPRFGVLRSREFLMKDAYSFDRDAEGLERTYRSQFDAYCRIFRRCGLNYVAVEAESGPIGGAASSEFMIPCDAGEDVLVRCTSCGYAANMEKAAGAPLAHPGASRRAGIEASGLAGPQARPRLEPLKKVATPNQKTIAAVCQFLGVQPNQLIKSMVYVVGDKPVMVCVRGDHDVNEAKLAHVLGGAAQLADENVIRRVTGAPVGFAGPAGLPDTSVPIYVDQAVTVMASAVAGANAADAHVTGLNPGRDFPLDRVCDVRFVVPGDLCPHCGALLQISRGIEVGHVFKLGTKYSVALGATYLDEKGASHPLVMGCYGIGVNRLIAAAVETLADDDGIVWPMTLAPYQVLVVALRADGPTMAAAEALYGRLAAAGAEALLDDRDARPGVKFKDADLIGVPLRVTVGERGLQEGVVELRDRKTKVVTKVPLAEAHQVVLREIQGQLAALNGA